MLVERGLRVMNVDVIGRSYDIAANYLRKTGVMPEGGATDDALLESIVALVQRGDRHPISVANKAIAKFRSDRLAA